MDALAVINEASVLVGPIDPTSVPDAVLPSVLTAVQTHVQIVQARVLALVTERGSGNLPSSPGAAQLVPWAADVLKAKRSTAQGHVDAAEEVLRPFADSGHWEAVEGRAALHLVQLVHLEQVEEGHERSVGARCQCSSSRSGKFR